MWGVLHTGDIAKRDGDGYYYITGRMKRFVKIWGNRCNLDSLEQMVKSITLDCACVGVDDRITVFVIKEGLEEQIKDMLSERTGLNKRAFSVVTIENIPKNTSGKVQYQELQKRIEI
jgi:acyl-coenzyme A synthetase/AMP-(fatty) acid ligase